MRHERVTRQIGLGIATTLVLGYMIGSGVFLLPASLAPYGAARELLLAFAAFGFCLWALVGAGKDAVFWNFVLLALGIPLYAWQARNTGRAAEVPR